jgi:hypothetical protein
MGMHRKIDWRAAKHEMGAARPRIDTRFMVVKALEAARVLTARNVAHARPLVVNGAYDLSAIMGAALAQARLDRSKGSTLAWSKLVGAALRFVWSRAKVLRKMGAH